MEREKLTLQSSKPTVHVVAAVVKKGDRILCTQRTRSHKSYNSERWEFPGGKVKEGESDHEALIREIREEMAWDVFVGRPAARVVHEYPDFIIDMTAYYCLAENDDFRLLEHLDARWLALDELDTLNWADADRKIVAQLKEAAFKS